MDQAPCERCPTCKQRITPPRRERLTPALAKALQEIHDDGGDRGYIEIDPYRFRGCHGRLRYWGLLETAQFAREAGSPQKRSARWKVTERGCRWLEGVIPVAESVWVRDDEVVEEEGVVYYGELVQPDRSPRGRSGSPPRTPPLAAPPSPRPESLPAPPRTPEDELASTVLWILSQG